MAERRMFASSIIDSDAFLDMPQSSQLLYFHLSMRADDDGFVNKPKSITRSIGAGDDDIRMLIAKKFIIAFDSGVIAIKHWRIHNYIRKDTYSETNYKEEKSNLIFDENKAYTLKKPDEINAVNAPSTSRDESVDAPSTSRDGSVDAGKYSLGKYSLDKNIYIAPVTEADRPKPETERKRKFGEYGHVLLTEKQYETLKSEYSNAEELISYLDEYIEMKGYKAKNHYLCIKKWVADAVSRGKGKAGRRKIGSQSSQSGGIDTETSSMLSWDILMSATGDDGG